MAGFDERMKKAQIIRGLMAKKDQLTLKIRKATEERKLLAVKLKQARKG